jgi:hypothetical protein
MTKHAQKVNCVRYVIIATRQCTYYLMYNISNIREKFLAINLFLNFLCNLFRDSFRCDKCFDNYSREVQ